MMEASPWQADARQRARIQTLLQALQEDIPRFWTLQDQDKLAACWEFKEIEGRAEFCQPYTQKLLERFGEAFLQQALADFLVFPDENPWVKNYRDSDKENRCLARLAFLVATEWLARQGGDYALDLVGQRLRYLLAQLEDHPPDTHKIYPRLVLHINECVQLLARRHQHPVAAELIDQLLRGDWDGPVAMPEASQPTPGQTTRYAVLGSELYGPLNEWGTGFDVPAFLCGLGRLDYARFLEIYRRFPSLIPFSQFWWGPDKLAALSEAQKQAYGYVQTLGWTIINDWDLAELERLRYYHVTCQGGHWLIAACERVETLGLETLAEQYDALKPSHVLRVMAGSKGLLAEEDPQAVLGRLRGFSERSLKIVLPWADGLQALLLQALGWGGLTPVLEWMRTFRALEEEMLARMQANEPRYGDGPEVDGETRQAMAAFLAQADQAQVQALVEIFRAAKLADAALTSLEALAGLNLKALEKSATRHHKMAAITAYGFAPLRDEAHLLERYLTFKKIAKDCAKYGAERQANSRDAVRVGLANLAQTAGYPDLARLEWAMEAKIGGEGAPLGQRETIADWEVELNLDGLVPTLAIFKQGKPLKTVPAGLRKLERFLAFKDAQANLKAQAGRFRAALENIMAEGESLAPEDLRNLAGLAVVRQLLQGLILRDEGGRYGWFAPDGPVLVGLDGAKTALQGRSLIAHPYHLFQDGVLPAWQQAVVRQRVVQPFKQAFRELYILTPAEEETGTYSNRFAGHSLKASIAGRLLQARGWRITGHGDWVEVHKAFPKAGLKAGFGFPDAYGHFTLVESVTSDRIEFFTRDRFAVALKDVPPLIFSEVMRDADLVVSVAQLAERDQHVSSETYERRAELVSALLADLGLKGVRCEGHFAYVKGKKANYRVHLGSAAIHIEPGNYLCVVPSYEAGARDTLFLPFADAEPKTSEVISKILLLANDHKIKDPSILAQIEAAARRGEV